MGINATAAGQCDTSGHRADLASELLSTGFIHCCHDYCRVACHLQCGQSRDVILALAELRRWPAALDWLWHRL
jgi:hypothetical protein